MAFCNSCGTALALGAKFCPKCGATTGATAAAPAATPTATAAPVSGAPVPAGGSSALKIILIILAIVVGLVIVAGGSCAYFIHRAIHSHVNNKNGEVSIDTPFGSLNGGSDPAEAAKNTGVEAYPDATLQQGSAASMTIGKMHTATATYESNDAPSAIADFYKSKYPDAQFTQNPNGQYSITSGIKDNLTTIIIEARGEKTRIVVAKVTTTGIATQ
jgi:hypothetical protein